MVVEEAPMPAIMDCDQHIFEPRDLWSGYADPAGRPLAIRMEEDPKGHTHVVWNGRRIALAHVTLPGETKKVGRYFADVRAGASASARYDELVPPPSHTARSRLARAAADPLYGRGTGPAQLKLHASDLGFRHQTTGEPLRFHAPARF
jgi:hypothetical protein